MLKKRLSYCFADCLSFSLSCSLSVFMSPSHLDLFFRSVRIPPHWVIIGPVDAVDSGHQAGSAPQSTEVMCLPWRCPAVPWAQWLRAGITSGLSDPGHGCQDKQLRYWRSREGASAGCFLCSHWISHLHAQELELNGLTALYGSSCFHSATLSLVMIVDRVRYVKRERERQKACLKEAGVCKNIWQHSDLTKIDGHCAQVCLTDP